MDTARTSQLEDSAWEDSAWKASMDLAMQAIVTIQRAAPFSFGNDSKGHREGTGFIVDIDHGIILTNREILSEGPMNARATFHLGTREGVIVPLLIDPIHDFGFCKFDIECLRSSCALILP